MCSLSSITPAAQCSTMESILPGCSQGHGHIGGSVLLLELLVAMGWDVLKVVTELMHRCLSCVQHQTPCSTVHTHHRFGIAPCCLSYTPEAICLARKTEFSAEQVEFFTFCIATKEKHLPTSSPELSLLCLGFRDFCLVSFYDYTLFITTVAVSF